METEGTKEIASIFSFGMEESLAVGRAAWAGVKEDSEEEGLGRGTGVEVSRRIVLRGGERSSVSSSEITTVEIDLFRESELGEAL